jgi:hypothetical protein
MDLHNYIVFGDSHSGCFSSVIQTHTFSASSAKGLTNQNSASQTNSKIRLIVESNKDKKFIFFFGKVDMDFILNHKYNLDIHFNMSEYVKTIVINYTEFIKSLGITPENAYICELPIPHLSDATLLKIINNPVHHYNLNKHLDDKYKPIRYSRVIPLTKRTSITLLFNDMLKKSGFNILSINSHFKDKIPTQYIRKNITDHHLDDSIHTLYLQAVTQSRSSPHQAPLTPHPPQA